MRCTIDSPKAQFPEDLDIIHNSNVLMNSAKHPDQAAAVCKYGREALDTVFEYFSNEHRTSDRTLKDPLINSKNVHQGFPQLKMTPQGHSRINFKTTRGLIMRDYKVFPEFAKLASIGLCMPVTSVPAECGFSLQNRIKTASSLSQKWVHRLMLLSSEANSHDHFPLAHTANISTGMRQHWKYILRQESF